MYIVLNDNQGLLLVVDFIYFHNTILFVTFCYYYFVID